MLERVFRIRIALLLFSLFLATTHSLVVGAEVEPTPLQPIASLPLVVIDPGHGGMDDGALGKKGVVEKNLVLDVAKYARVELERSDKVRVLLTREEDVFVPLAERTALANDRHAALFVSLHANATPKSNASGLETFYLDNTDDKAAKSLAERENASLRFENGEADIAMMLSDLIQSGKLEDSIILANFVQSALRDSAREQWPEANDLGVKKAPFYVLVGAHMPCILTELFFVDNPKDESHLLQDNFRKLLGRGLAAGILKYIQR